MRVRTHAHARHNKGTAPTNIACRPRGAGVPGFTPFNGDGVDTISFWIKNKGSPGSPVPVRVGASSFGLWLLQSNAALRGELHPIACCHLERRGASRSFKSIPRGSCWSLQRTGFQVQHVCFTSNLPPHICPPVRCWCPATAPSPPTAPSRCHLTPPGSSAMQRCDARGRQSMAPGQP